MSINCIKYTHTCIGRVVGGTDVKSTHEFPEYVSLRSFSGGGAFCGGTILDETHILTAAHCTDPKYIKAGDIQREGSNGTFPCF